jgi:ADP-ribose pyrophosphatase YjhB (NUDIX family)
VTWESYVGAGAIVSDRGRVLLVRQRREYGVHWELPGGYVEGGESLEQGARREVAEEASVDVEIGDLVCTVLWEREHDRRRNVLAYFAARPLDGREPRPQLEEDIDAAEFVDPATFDATVHPLEQAVLDGWTDGRVRPFHLYATIVVHADGTREYRFR